MPERYTFLDVFSLDDDVICSLTPHPVHAVILLFPDTDAIVAMRREEKCMDAETSNIVWIPQVDVGEFYLDVSADKASYLSGLPQVTAVERLPLSMHSARPACRRSFNPFSPLVGRCRLSTVQPCLHRPRRSSTRIIAQSPPVRRSCGNQTGRTQTIFFRSSTPRSKGSAG